MELRPRLLLMIRNRMSKMNRMLEVEHSVAEVPRALCGKPQNYFAA